ncbi:MAG TPA: protein TolR [Alphaproteobacteria bacterium]|nr:protein TolR [Alphaproteobacteria bacterium]
MAIFLSAPTVKRGGRLRRPPMSDINVTPMVDVMLVLLVIFMVTAPLLNVGVPVDLPKTTAAPITGQDEPLVISVNAKGNVYLQETEIPIDNLAARLQAITQNKPDTRIFVRGDRSINYGRIMEVMGVINLAGFKHVALVAEMPTSAPKEQKGAR